MENECEECLKLQAKDADAICEDCCDHSDYDMDDRICLICNKDLTEDLMARAYDMAKDRWKYGE